MSLKKGNEAAEIAEVAISYGNFINVIIQFLIIAFCIFLVIKGINSFKRAEEEEVVEEDPDPTKEETLLAEIRDLSKKIKKPIKGTENADYGRILLK